MNIRNRMPDIVKLRCNACQDLLKLVILPDWQGSLYAVASQAVERNTIYYNSYINVYNEMRDIGVENYSIDKMDVSLIYAIVSYWNGPGRNDNHALLGKDSISALKELKDDRNVTQHSNENEDPEELYLRGLMALNNLRKFIKTIDATEVQIDTNTRLAYRQKYIAEIEALKDTLDNERIELVQKVKEIDRDIQQIKDSKEPMRTWADIHKSYHDRAMAHRDDKEEQRLQEFCIRASDAGIPFAHSYAAIHYLYSLKNPAEATKRLKMMLESESELSWQTCKIVIDDINWIINRYHESTKEILQLIEYIKNHGHAVEERNGCYILLEWEKREKERLRKRT